MGISLNNHESRIKALESGGSSTWTKGSNSNGFWVKENTTGLIIQWMTYSGNRDGWKTITFPTPYSDTNYSITSSIFGSSTDPSKYCDYISKISTTQFKQYTIGTGSRAAAWIAIGYLISDRILNYTYACKSLLFTPLRKIGGVK